MHVTSKHSHRSRLLSTVTVKQRACAWIQRQCTFARARLSSDVSNSPCPTLQIFPPISPAVYRLFSSAAYAPSSVTVRASLQVRPGRECVHYAR
eukprot:2933212-Pleurochrysis_carterae.AAC.1